MYIQQRKMCNYNQDLVLYLLSILSPWEAFQKRDDYQRKKKQA